MKNLFAVILIFVIILNSSACSKPENVVVPEKKPLKYKIGIMTGTTSQGEEEFRAAENMVNKYKDLIVFKTYPDSFVNQQNITREKLIDMAKDPEIKAIIMCQVVQGSVSAFTEIRKMRPDMLIIGAVPSEDLETVVKEFDIVLQGDDLAAGYTIPAQAKKLGAKTFVHYSFPRHMSYKLISLRRDIIKDECKNLGLKFIDVTIPDPLGESGLEGARSFIIKDIKEKIALYGKDTNFFSTNCGMQEPLIKTALEYGGIVAQQCCPSPLHGYPGALGIKIPKEKFTDDNYVMDEIEKQIVLKGGKGRFSTWPVPMNMLFVEAGVEYAKGYIEGTIKSKNDSEALARICSKIVGVKDIKLNIYVGRDKNGRDIEYNNFYLFLCDYITF